MKSDRSDTRSTEHQRLVLKLLRSRPGISRSELMRRTGLSKATVSQIVSRLIEKNILREDGVAAQVDTVGRPPVRLSLNGEFRFAIGVELTGFDCVAALLDLYSTPLHIARLPLPDRSVETAVVTIERIVDELLTGCDRTRLLGIGVGVPGMVAVDQQTVVLAVNLGWFDVPLGALVRDRLQMDTIVVKRQAAGALGEYWHGIGRRKAVLMYVSIGSGIGSGILMHGRLFSGAIGSAGEIGHVTIVPDGPRCQCGNYGCLEAVASCPAMLARAKEKVKEAASSRLHVDSRGVVEAITSEMLFAAAQAGDPVAVDVIQEAAGYVGLALADAVNMFNPAMIIVGGDVAALGEQFLTPVREVVRRRALSAPAGILTICSSTLGEQAASIGAGSLVIDRFFSPPWPEEADTARSTVAGEVGLKQT